MSVYLPSKKSKTYVYDFWWQGRQYKDSTYQTSRSEALLVEAKKKLALRAAAGGLTPLRADETPTFSDWAEIALAYQAQFITRPAILERTFRMVLAFWGAEPTTPIGPAAVVHPERAPRPYHNLRLGDPIADPAWLERFEAWMQARGLSGSTRNSYLSACSDLYTCALQPQYRATTGITTNPFVGIRRSPTRTRVLALTPAQILALVDQAGRHIAHALCLAALAPKLRVATILALEWDVHLDPDRTTITVADHKTRSTTGRAQIVPVSAQLREILADIRAAQIADDVARQARGRKPAPLTHVITWHGRRVGDIKTGLRRAVTAVGLPWGLRDGVTFHVMRHSVATILANPKLVGTLTERLRADVMGHLELRTTQQYTHLNTSVQEGPHEALSAALSGLRAALAPKHPRRAPKVEGPPSEIEAKGQRTPTVDGALVPTQKRA